MHRRIHNWRLATGRSGFLKAMGTAIHFSRSRCWVGSALAGIEVAAADFHFSTLRNKTMKAPRPLLAALAGLCLTAALPAHVPNPLNYQGRGAAGTGASAVHLNGTCQNTPATIAQPVQ